MSNKAIEEELARVRKLKRALEAEIELLRDDMENGKVRLRVSEDKDFRRELSERMVEIRAAGYDKVFQGWYVADPVEGKVYHCREPFVPYYENLRYRIVPIEELFDEMCDYQISIDWYERIQQYSDLDALTEEYIAEHPDEDEEVYKEDLVEWIRNEPQYREMIAEIENEAWEEAVGFALENIKDEVIVEI